MTIVSKLLVIDPDNNYLLLYRNNHPVFGNDPDLPGGTVEANESTEAAVIREAKEEIQLQLNSNQVSQIILGTEASSQHTGYELYESHLKLQPEITLSWEHSKYEWLSKNDFLAKAQNAKDKYMHMVFEVLSKK